MHQSVQLVDIFDLVALRFDQLGTARDSERQNNRDPSHQEHQEESQTHGKARLPTYPRREGLTLPRSSRPPIRRSMPVSHPSRLSALLSSLSGNSHAPPQEPWPLASYAMLRTTPNRGPFAARPFSH